jgi:hypothetical protein
MSNQEQTSGRVEKCCQKLGRFMGEYAYKVLSKSQSCQFA